MIRFSGQVTVFRATVPRPGPAADFAFESKNVIDQFTSTKWRELGIAPSELCTDEQFIRRASLDITGTLPTANAVTQFVEDADPSKRNKLIDRLVDSPEYSFVFANKWADVLRVKRRGQTERASGTLSFHTWIREAIAADKPYDEFVREIVCAIGNNIIVLNNVQCIIGIDMCIMKNKTGVRI